MLNKKEWLNILKENLYKLNRTELHYISYIAEEMSKGNEKYRVDKTREEFLKDFDEWKSKQTECY